MKDYIEMWKELDLDLSAHDELLKVLSGFYQDIYLSQQDRPKGMGYFDFVMSEIHGLRVKELVEAKKQGQKVFGTFCVFVPEELIWAVDGICVGLCAGAEAGKEEAERVLPRTLCPLIKSFMGFKIARLCPFIEVSDLIIGETTCDGKKKTFEILSSFKPTYVMEIPQMKKQNDFNLLKEEVLKLKDEIEKTSNKKITEENLSDAIRLINKRRKALQRLNKLRQKNPFVISGKDALLVNQISFYDDPVRFTEKVNILCDELEDKIDKKQVQDKARILISGCPMAVPNWKIPHIVESSNAVIVDEESCIGERNTRELVDESGTTFEEMIENIVKRYMKIDCACFTPNEERIENIVSLAKKYNVDGVIHYTLQYCDPYLIEAYRVEKALEKESIPVLRIETDYSLEDTEQLKTRIEAFVEMLR